MGNQNWWTSPPGVGLTPGWSLSTTMDGGGCEEDPQSSKGICGIISRHDFQGNELWRDYVHNSGCDNIYSIRQLSQGGYIAAGQAGNQGFLIKYAPELGFESQEVSPSMKISSISPNPFSVVTEIQFSIAEPGEASLTVFDLNGRVVDVLIDGLFSEGEHTLQWAPVGISSSCYLVRLTTSDDSVTRNMVLIK